ncbi:MAG: peptidylprolyl isomerase [Candidatus Diapherotrites archaeon]|nr:peptidylprolyl isomerase [Candidatus Diapherotrites archaeon]
MAFQEGDIVRVDYTVKRDGEVFETTREEVAVKEGIFDEKRKYAPAIAIIGEQNFFEKVDNELRGMDVGQKRVVKLEPKDAFGERKPELIRMVALKEFKRRNIVPFPGLVVDLNGLQGRVQSVSGGRVRVDFNHPLAGKDIEFELEVVERIEGKERKAQALIERYFSFAKDDAKASFENDSLVVECSAEKLLGSDALRNSFARSALKCLPVKKVKFVEVFDKEFLDKQKETEQKVEEKATESTEE